MTSASGTPPVTASQEWRAHGMVVISALLGVSLSALPTAALGLFMEPLSREFGWSRTEISFGLSIMAVMGLPLAPLGGMIVDKFGPRRVAIPGLATASLVIAGFSLMTGAYWQWLAMWVLLALTAMGTRILVWNTAVSTFFTASRGFAIAILLCGTALGTALVPTITHWLIDGWGWRFAYVGLGLGWGGVALLMVVLFFRDGRGVARSQTATTAPAAAPRLGGLTVREAVRTVRLYRIAGAIFLISGMGSAVMVHLVPMLTADGLTRAEAAGMAAIIGGGSIIGKLLTGWLIDRFTGSIIPFVCFAGPSIAFTLLLQPAASALMLSVAVFIQGFCSGAALHLATYLTTRYAGMRSFGTIFGLISSFLALSSAIGPPLAGAIFDATGSYDLLLMGCIPGAILAGLLVVGLGPYPVFKAPEEEPPMAAPVPATT